MLLILIYYAAGTTQIRIVFANLKAALLPHNFSFIFHTISCDIKL